MIAPKAKDINSYIAGFEPAIQDLLVQIRATIKEVVPEAEETISYGIPTFNLNGTYLIYFAAYKKHIGIYPVSDEFDAIGNEYSCYKRSGKGTLQFPIKKPIPTDLIVKLIRYNAKKAVERLQKKKQFN